MEDASQAPETSLMSSVTDLFFGSPVNTVLTVICAYLVYRLFKGNSAPDNLPPPIKIPPPLPKHNMTLQELKNYDGSGEDGRVCVAILGKVFDVTKGRRFYGPEGPYCTFAGRDATRALATFDVNAIKLEWDDHEGLTSSQLSSVQEWEMQFSERYDLVGKLVKEGEEEDNAEEEDVSQDKPAN
ncbi:Membrane-associated progesterone receptor component 1 [Halotydeus destructor]|nr:Membrane-associated progesterone receptor component 1 [Halotydeus destructor]